MKNQKRKCNQEYKRNKNQLKTQNIVQNKQKLPVTSIYFQFMDKNSNEVMKNQLSIQKRKKQSYNTKKSNKNNEQNDIKANQLQIDLKDKINHLIDSLKLSKTIDKYQKQKKEKLKKQWRYLQNQKHNNKKLSKNSNLQLQQIKKQISNTIKNDDIETYRNQNNDFKNILLQKIKPSQIDDKEIKKQNCTDYMNQTFRSIKSRNNFNYQKIKNHNHTHNFDKKYKTQAINFIVKPHRQLNPSSIIRLKSKQQLKRINQNEKYTNEKMSNTIIQSQNTYQKKYDRPILFNSTKKSSFHMSKSVMVQKIISLRKSFNDKFKKNQNNRTRSKSKQFIGNNHKNSQSNIISVINSQNIQKPQSQLPGRKMTFQQIFQLQKVKFQLLKNLVTQGKYDSDRKQFKANINSLLNYQNEYFQQFYSDQNSKNIQFNDQFNEFIQNKNFNINDFININLQKNCLLKKDTVNQIQQNNYSPKKLNFEQNQFDDNTLLEQYQKGTNFICINGVIFKQSLPKKRQNSHQKYEDQTKQLKLRSKSQLYSPITNYNFDQIKKFNIQKPEIKELRHKYLYKTNNQQYSPKTKTKITKQQCNKYGISIVSVYDKNQSHFTLSDWRKRRSFSNQNMGDQFLQVDKKISWKRKENQYQAANFHKMNFKQNKRAFNMKRSFLKAYQNQKLYTVPNQFAPWEKEQQDFQLKDSTFIEF